MPEPSEAAVAYYPSANLIWAVDQAWSMLVLIALLATGLSARLRTIAVPGANV